MASPRRRRREDRTRAVVVGSLVAAALAAVLLYAVVRFAADNPDQANLGSPVLRLNAERLAGEIAERGPVLFKDPLDRDREVFIQHLGDDESEGWLAVRAYAAAADLDCLLQWEPDPGRFVDPCTRSAYPADGTGLVTYPATVAGATVTVDLRTPRGAAPAR